ncbi:MAG: glycosyltransferase family 4 protein [Limnochordia bacterium]|jgi:glycosyltransferase involved in cell wall biosynthesis
MRIMWVIRPVEGGMLSHLSQLLEGMADQEILIAAPGSLQKWADGRQFFTVDIGDGLNLRADLRAACEVRRLVRQHRPHVVHSHGLKAALVTGLGLSLYPKRPPLVFTVHNNLPSPERSYHRAIYRLVHRRLLRSFDMVITVSDAVRDQLLEYTSPSRVITIRNGIPVERFGRYPRTAARAELGLSEGCRVVGLVARLIAGKGINTALEAASLLTKIIPDLHIVIVGDGPERARLESYAAALGLGSSVHFLGWREDVPALMAGWDVFILPSRSEGFSLSVLEAMASGLPVVVSDLACMREAVVSGKGGYLTRPGDAPELAAAILNVLRDNRRASQMGKFNRERAAALFGEDRMIQCTRAVYEGLSQS